MLVLTRKRNEMIRIGDDVVIKVIKTGKGAIKIGIEAPSNVRVLRAELPPFEEIQAAEDCAEEEAGLRPDLIMMPQAV
ncbi:MAG: carbon storage regulator [Planctomycetaceae bacterium]|jgi:carbon storage regulator CsrA|nr:carbon storage regulator [Planctomycetaceae bacterium]MDB4786720.1 carbon storage regulator [Planctomycetaceae bacterium]MDC0274051.1 carbon storage regulator [Planctomycetaceae bacterium]MDG2388789.1 carbon storage regulator [Planctomycetaceae bacterium]